MEPNTPQKPYIRIKLMERYFIEGKDHSFGTSQAAYRSLARRRIASEFDHLGWVSDKEGYPSPALAAFRKKWMYFKQETSKMAVLTAKPEYYTELERLMNEMRAHDVAIWEAERAKR